MLNHNVIIGINDLNLLQENGCAGNLPGSDLPCLVSVFDLDQTK